MCYFGESNEQYQFEMLVEDLHYITNGSRNPIFDTMFSYQNIEADIKKIADVKFANYEYEENISKFDINMSVKDMKDSMVCDWEYCTKLFEKETIKKFAEYYNDILSIVTEDKDILIENIKIGNQDENNIDLEDVEFDF